ncbi:hypothetical protein HHK36_030878 [Tetracentron sinense]|uniref:LOB domain-containing protein n=1 Tax=Tetracentron sinense TaxID=13715 RepID=A0A835CYP7_TETSI|nr:hypothetical protein HHK36_030878 [Tetracentron sinense]
METTQKYPYTCARCKWMRMKCTKECEFAPYFPGNDPKKFENVKRLFGASNVSKLLKNLDPRLREAAVKSMVYEANARVNDPVYGCVRLVVQLQQRIKQVQLELNNTMKQVLQLRRQHQNSFLYNSPLFIREPQQHEQQWLDAQQFAAGEQQEMLRMMYEQQQNHNQMEMLRMMYEQQQEPQRQQQQMLAAQEYTAVVAAGEQQEMLRMQYEQQQQQNHNQMEMLRRHHGGQLENQFQVVQTEPQQPQGDGRDGDRGVGPSF